MSRTVEQRKPTNPFSAFVVGPGVYWAGVLMLVADLLAADDPFFSRWASLCAILTGWLIERSALHRGLEGLLEVAAKESARSCSHCGRSGELGHRDDASEGPADE